MNLSPFSPLTPRQNDGYLTYSHPTRALYNRRAEMSWSSEEHRIQSTLSKRPQAAEPTGRGPSLGETEQSLWRSEPAKSHPQTLRVLSSDVQGATLPSPVSSLQRSQDAHWPCPLLRGPTVSRILALSLGMLKIGILLLTAGPMETRTRDTRPNVALTLLQALPSPHLLRANFSRKTSGGHHAQHVSVNTPQGGCVRSRHKGPGRQALQEPWCSPTRPCQLQPEPQFHHLLLLLSQAVTLQDTVQGTRMPRDIC